MALVSMKTESGSDCCTMETNPYGYGLEIRLSEDQCKALGLSSPIPAGTKVSIEALSFVKSATECADDDEKETEVSMCLQITDLSIAPAKAGTKAAADVFYGGKD